MNKQFLIKKAVNLVRNENYSQRAAAEEVGLDRNLIQYYLQHPESIATRGTLCWQCQNYINGCSWSRSCGTKPVEGWEAVQEGISYTVIKCPEFIQDEYREVVRDEPEHAHDYFY